MNIFPAIDLYDGKAEIVKDKELVLVPTTCGTGSEVTNIAILALNSRGTKKGLAVDEMYADSAVLVPELLNGLPFRFFATSSIDALIHAVESSLSPKGNEMTRAPGKIDPEVQKLVLGDEKPITQRYADLLEPGFEKAKRELGERAHSDEDVLSYIAFPAQAEAFFEKRDRKEDDNEIHFSIREVK